MRIRVLASAVADLHDGRLFYEEQAEGVGAYFFDSLTLNRTGDGRAGAAPTVRLGLSLAARI